jgi:hypothetical protein
VSSLDPHRLAPDRAMRLAAMVARRHGIKDPIQPLRTGANYVFRASLRRSLTQA